MPKKIYISDYEDEKCKIRSRELIDEFRSHYQEFMDENPNYTGGPRVVFEGWAIQKIAGLQRCIEIIVTHINSMN